MKNQDCESLRLSWHNANKKYNIKGEQYGYNARVGIEVDDIFITEWSSQYLDPEKSEVGYVSIGRLSEGQHTVLVYVNPGSGRSDHNTNTFNVE